MKRRDFFHSMAAGGLAQAGLAACPMAPAGTPGEGPAADFSWLDARLADRVASGYFDGMTLLVGRGEQILHRAVFGNGAPGCVLHVASTGKWVAAATIAAVVDEGGLAWTDTAQSILPELRGDKGRATLRQLLSHTAGYPDYQPAGRQRDHYATLEQSVAQLRDLPAASAPGVEFRYGGLAMQVAGRMAEVATGLAFNEIFLSRIAATLGMTASGFSPVSAEPGFSPMLGGGMFTSADDYARFHLKYGVTYTPLTRYTAAKLKGGNLKILTSGSREEILKLERDLHKTCLLVQKSYKKFTSKSRLIKAIYRLHTNEQTISISNSMGRAYR